MLGKVIVEVSNSLVAANNVHEQVHVVAEAHVLIGKVVKGVIENLLAEFTRQREETCGFGHRSVTSLASGFQTSLSINSNNRESKGQNSDEVTYRVLFVGVECGCNFRQIWRFRTMQYGLFVSSPALNTGDGVQEFIS